MGQQGLSMCLHIFFFTVDGWRFIKLHTHPDPVHNAYIENIHTSIVFIQCFTTAHRQKIHTNTKPKISKNIALLKCIFKKPLLKST